MKKEKEILLGQFCDLVTTLSDTEIEIARKHIIAYDSNTTGQSQKMFRLFSEIVYKGTKKYDTLKEIISKDSSDYSFNRLIRRTLYRLQESLIVEVNINRKGMYSEIFRKRFEIRKRIIQAHIIHGKGLPKMANRIFDNIIKSTKKFELYDELIEALLLKQSVILLIKGKKTFDRINEQVHFYHKCRDLLQKSKNIYRTYISDVYSKGIAEDKLKYLKESTDTIFHFYEETNSANILSQYYLLQLEYFQLMKWAKEEENVGLELLELLNNNKAVYSDARIAYVWNSLANSMLGYLNFEKCLQYAKESYKCYEGSMKLGLINSILQQINAAFYLQKYDKVKPLIEKVRKLSFLEKYPYHISIVNYYHAMNNFSGGEYKKTTQLLANLNEIEKDKEGWNIWIRIMRILCLIELLKLNMIDYDMENFRKYIQRVDKQYSVRKRDKLILSILLELDRNVYDFKLVAKKKKAILDKLRSTKKEYSWDPSSPEMILFHDWFDAKLKNKAYQPDFEPYRKELAKASK